MSIKLRKCIYCGKPVEDKKIEEPGYLMQNLNFHLDCLAGKSTGDDEEDEEFGPPGGFAPGFVVIIMSEAIYFVVIIAGLYAGHHLYRFFKG